MDKQAELNMEDAQASLVNPTDINEQIADIQREIDESKALLQIESENKRQDIKETIIHKEKLLICKIKLRACQLCHDVLKE